MSPSTPGAATLRALARGEHASPFDLLGMHRLPGAPGVVVRTLQPHADAVEVVDVETGTPHPMTRVHPDGVFAHDFVAREPFPYRLRISEGEGTREIEDPYRFPLQIGDFDLYLFGEGTHYRTYLHMGAHVRAVDGVDGVRFAVWAPNARRVSVVGDFNRWDGRCHPMQKRGDSGLWEIFVPGLRAGDLYKYEIKGPHGSLATKADPYAFAGELRPQTASVVWDLDGYAWGDADWMARRRETDWMTRPISVYEVHLGSWRRPGANGRPWMTYDELADTLIPYALDLGYTHLELLPVSEHPHDASWGYQTIGYFAPTSRFGSPDGFRRFVDRCHQAGLGVLLDWVPAHFPRDAHGLAFFDGTHLYEHADPRRGEHREWGTLIFNLGRHEVSSFLLSNAMYWADVYHIDGLRVDAVASMLYLDYSREADDWLPNEHGGRENLDAVRFLKRFNEVIHAEYPGILTFAEESTAWPMVSRPTYLGGLGFGFKWNMGWMNDTLAYFALDPVHRKYHHQNLTFSLLYAFSENFLLPLSHDEVVHGKRSLLGRMPGDDWQRFANLRLLYAYLFAHPGKKLLFMGGEIAQPDEWDCSGEVPWHLLEHAPHRQIQALVRDLNGLYRGEPALHEVDFSWDGFEWIDLHDADQSVASFLRFPRDRSRFVVCVLNATPVPRAGYRLGVPRGGVYRERLNTDAACYGGSNVGNAGRIEARDEPWSGRPHSLVLTLPPLGALFLTPALGDAHNRNSTPMLTMGPE